MMERASKKFTQAGRLTACASLMAVARISFAGWFAWFFTVKLGSIHMSLVSALLFSFLFILGMASALAALIVSITIKCDACTRRLAITWGREKRTAVEQGRVNAIVDFFYPAELRFRSVQCPHCGTAFLL